jgi:hypothetical protein
MRIGYLPWNQSAAAVDRVCIRDGEAELTYARWPGSRRSPNNSPQRASAGETSSR